MSSDENLFRDEDRKTLTGTFVAPVDLGSAEGWIVVDGVRYPVTWSGAATGPDGKGKWTRVGTTAAFAGPKVPSGDIAGAVVLAYGEHTIEQICKAGGTILSTPPVTFRIRA